MRRQLSWLVLCAIFLSIISNNRMAYAKSGRNKEKDTPENNNVMFSEHIHINGCELAKPEKRIDKNDVKNNLLGLLNLETETRENLSAAGNDFVIDKAMYIRNKTNIACSNVIISAPLVSCGDVLISARNVIIKDTGFLLSVKGNIKVNCSNLVIEGPVCVDNKLFICCSNMVINEAIFADRIECNVGTYRLENTVNETHLAGRNDLAAELYLEENDTISYICGKANFDYVSMDIYGREQGKDSYSLLLKDVKAGQEVPIQWERYVGFAAIMRNSFGFVYKSNPLETTIENGMYVSSQGVDSDGDGVTDDYEIWLAETNPREKDDFSEIIEYVYLSFDKDIVCYDRLFRRPVSWTTEDYVKTYFYDCNNRKSKVEVIYNDGANKTLCYEYEGDDLKSIIVGKNEYSILDNGSTRCYYINGNLIKKISKSLDMISIDYLDLAKEIACIDNSGNIVKYQNKDVYEMTYNELDLLVRVVKNGNEYGTFSYDDYGGFRTVDTMEYSARYDNNQDGFKVEYAFGEIRKEQRVHRVDGNATADGKSVLTDGSDGSMAPRNIEGVVEFSDLDKRIFQYTSCDTTHTIKFDQRGQVVSDTAKGKKDDGQSFCMETEYAYDFYGNIERVTVRDGESCCEQIYAYDKEWSDVLVEFDGNHIYYDVFGKPTKYYNGMEFSWATGRLSKIVNGEMLVSYQYDIEGFRKEKEVNDVTTKYIYEGNELIAELGENPLFYTYDADNKLIGFEWNNEGYYYQYNLFGDVVAVVNKEGNVVCEYDYDIWGKLISVKGDKVVAKRNPIRYRGYYYDEESGFYYLESRYYDPICKRFLSYDDVESILYGVEENVTSLYVYCDNNPVCLLDKNGCAAYPNIIFTTKEWSFESFIFKQGWNSLMDIYFCGLGKFATTYTMASTDDFVQEWNGIGSKEVIVINAHGNYYYFGDSGVFVTIETITNRLNKKNLKVLWLLSCYNGKSSRMQQNVARAFAKKITGTVIASDGTVEMKNLQTTTYKSAENGWYTYRFTNYGSTLSCIKLNKNELSIIEMLKITGLYSAWH